MGELNGDKEAQRARAVALLNQTMAYLGIRNDAELCRVLEVAPPMISKIRNGHIGLSDSMLIRLHEVTGWSVRQLKSSLGQECLDQRLPAA